MSSLSGILGGLFTGPQGISGFSGFSGAGSSGVSGYSGFTGVSGFSGWTGVTGVSGFSGWTGVSGRSGWSGWTGVSGRSGWSGWTGVSGRSGWSGWTGVSGFSGVVTAISLTASEALVAGDIVNIYNNAGTANVRKANATAAGKEAHGFVIAAVSASATATVYSYGTTSASYSGLTPGTVYLSTTAGLPTGTAPSASGNVVQRIGVAISATQILFLPGEPVTLA